LGRLPAEPRCLCPRRSRRTRRGRRCARLGRSDRACSWLPWRPPEIEVQARASRRRTPLPRVRPRRFRVRAFRRVRRRSSRALVLWPWEPSIMSGAGPFTRLRVFRFAPAHGTETRGEPPARGLTVGGACFASVSFRRGGGKGIVSITAGNAALSRRCALAPKQHGAP